MKDNKRRALGEFGDALIVLGRRMRKLARRDPDHAEIQRALDDLRAAVSAIATTDN